MSSGTLTPRGKEAYRFATQCATIENPDAGHKDHYGSSQVPIYQTATFKGVGQAYDYSRSGNPTRTYLEHHVAKISSAQFAFAVTSGMAALDVIFRLLKPGDEIIAGNDLYGGSNRLLTYLKSHNGIITHHVPTTDPSSLLPFLTQPNSKVTMILLETPTNPLLQIADIKAIADLVHEYLPNALVVVDNTMMSPYLQRPLEHGADLVYDSGTKYLSGHHDLMAGVISCNREDIAKGIAFTINSIGNGLPSFDCFLLLRGIKTLALRLDRQQASTQLIAEYLQNLGFKVNYPGLANHPGKEVHDRLASGAGAVLSFETGDKELSERIVEGARLWGISVSFGCVNSLISMPCLMSHASIDPKLRKERNLPEDLIRLCIGIEDVRDLIDDLEFALLGAGAVRVMDEASTRRTLERVKNVGESFDQLVLSEEVVVVGELVTSAPGKVILFGEHAVVHGVTAIAGAISLRCYNMSYPLPPDQLSLSLPDVGFEQKWNINQLPWSLITRGTQIPRSEEVPDTVLLGELEQLVKSEQGPQAKIAAVCFLYLYMSIAHQNRVSRAFTTRSALPLGAGLGSSAAYAVSLSSALLYSSSLLILPPSSESSMGIDKKSAELINAWAFVGEKIMHGTPSGVDNTVSTLGGAIAFSKSMPGGKQGSLQLLSGFQSINFLLTDSGVTRFAKILVEGVAKRKLMEPEIINPLLASIQVISTRAITVLSPCSSSLTSTLSIQARKEQIKTLEELMKENHELLVSLGVGHPKLEEIRILTKQGGLVTKLTGAGGGGCAVTILPDHFPIGELDNVKRGLEGKGFRIYEASVGGAGAGIWSVDSACAAGLGQKGVDSFVECASEKLGEWAEGFKGWKYV